MLCIAKAGQAEQTIHKSRFIATAEYCPDERAVGFCLRRLAAVHAGAHHLAYAYRLKTEQGVVQRFHDAGEPSGTAGKPLLQFIEGRELINVCLAVVRYYGGINLGTGGLARAYGGTGRMALEAAKFMPFVEMQQVRLLLDYKHVDGFMRDLAKQHGEVLDKQFGERVAVVALLPASAVEDLLGRYALK